MKTLASEIQRADQGRTVVGHNILGVVLCLAAGVAMHFRAHPRQERLEFLQPFFPAPSATGEQDPDPHIAPARFGQRIEDFEVGATKQGKRQAGSRRDDHLEHCRPPFLRRQDHPFRNQGPRFRPGIRQEWIHPRFLAGSHATDLIPEAPPSMSFAFSSSSEAWGPSATWYRTAVSLPWEISRGSNSM